MVTISAMIAIVVVAIAVIAVFSIVGDVVDVATIVITITSSSGQLPVRRMAVVLVVPMRMYLHEQGVLSARGVQ
jgi:hypothetical protein